MLPRRHLTVLLSLLPIALFAAAPARALAAEVRNGKFLSQEVAGLEIHGVSLVQGDGVSPQPAAGLGALLRLGRHRWTQAYFTPFQFGLFVGTSGEDRHVISARALTEGGWITRTGAGVLELGLGAGAGYLSVAYRQNGCDGSCGVGGVGVLFSPVARFLFREATNFPVGVVLRGEVPLMAPSDAHYHITGWGSQVLLGLDVGGGW